MALRKNVGPSKIMNPIRTVLGLLATLALVMDATAQTLEPLPPPPPSLKEVLIPLPETLDAWVMDRGSAIQLGKALFWDTQVSSDGKVSCATCHHQAGSDSRKRATVHAGVPASITKEATYATLAATNFPFAKQHGHRVGSAGISAKVFSRMVAGQPVETAVATTDPGVRQVTGRHSQSVINSVYNHRSFWDGRANNTFNGRSPFGERDTNAYAYIAVNNYRSAVLFPVGLTNASLASQAVGPVLSPLEMSYHGRSWLHVARKLLPARPLLNQTVHTNDSELGLLSQARVVKAGKGLTNTYRGMIRAAFPKFLWGITNTILPSTNLHGLGAGATVPAGKWTQDELNFSIFFGLSVMLYESTLVSDDSPYDRYVEGNAAALTTQQKTGLNLFLGKAACINCHSGPEFTGAAISRLTPRVEADPLGAPVPEREQLLERMLTGSGKLSVYDTAFYNIGVRAISDDPGIDARDPWGNPLSHSSQFTNWLAGADMVDNVPVDPTRFTFPLGLFPDQRPFPASTIEQVPIAVAGAFKTPTLRNVELNGPYFHHGGFATLRQVVDFYDRGGDFSSENRQVLDADIESLGMNDTEKAALVAFLISLTDDRVRTEKAPFDHPELTIPNGPALNANGTLKLTTAGKITETWITLPAVGATGGVPIKPFLGLSPQKL